MSVACLLVGMFCCCSVVEIYDNFIITEQKDTLMAHEFSISLCGNLFLEYLKLFYGQTRSMCLRTISYYKEHLLRVLVGNYRPIF